MTSLIKPKDFHACVSKLRQFFLSVGFIEVHPQSAQSILAACEDPKTISTYNYGKSNNFTNKKDCTSQDQQLIWPLPQTGQMWLEHVLLDNPDIKGCFAVTTSYRNEPDPIPGRHETIFPMFEFESKGDMNELINMEKSLLRFLGFPEKLKTLADVSGPRIDSQNICKMPGETCEAGPLYHGLMTEYGDIGTYMYDFSARKNFKSRVADSIIKSGNPVDYPEGNYIDIAKYFNIDEIEAREEALLCEKEGPVFFLKNFPRHTSPFWNMKMDGDIAKKVDVILHGQETIGSAERSCDIDEMKYMFHTISNGEYADILYNKFTKERVTKEFDEFIKKDFFPRYGGGIGMTRMIRAMKLSDLIAA